MTSSPQPQTIRRRVSVEGIVQGVGFRPHVHRLARDLGLTGTALNIAGGLEVEIEGPADVVAEFIRRVEADAPPIAVIDSVAVEELEPLGDAEFAIVPSRSDAAGEIYISPDVAICADCARELRDPADRRFGHPFINCTNCGPRFTIVEGVPYDRPKTSMGVFPMCSECRAEYADIADRRYHAQPVACPRCGPRVSFVFEGESCEGPDAIASAQEFLRAGRIIAVKGLGGFHLACDADNDAAVRRLRARKHREAKPLAVMAADLATIRGFAHVSDLAETLLTGPEAPIVIVDRNNAAPLADSVAPDTATYGVLLPYTPLHILLLDGLDARALVMTSGNLTDEPLATDNEEAMARLGAIADGFLLHDRAIFIGCDDSVIRPTARGPIIMRRSRGYVPFPVRLRRHSVVGQAFQPVKSVVGQTSQPVEPVAGQASQPAKSVVGQASQPAKSVVGQAFQPVESIVGQAFQPVETCPKYESDRLESLSYDDASSPPTILAVGGHLKNTFCITRGTNAFLSQHIGDLETLETLEYFERSIEHFKMILQVEPEGLACDLHPGFLSTHYAEELARDHALPLERVQHHHAHLAAVLADNRLPGPAVGVICDGTGFGADGTIWGCELLVGDAAACERAGHLRTIRLPGGEAAIREPWRLAAAWLQEAYGPGFADELAIPFTEQLDREAWRTLAEMMERGINAPEASSAGRLFDAVAALIGLYQRVEYEAQAPMKLEAVGQAFQPVEPVVGQAFQPVESVVGQAFQPVEPVVGQAFQPVEPVVGQAFQPVDSCLDYDSDRLESLSYNDPPLILDPAPILRAIVDGIRQGLSQGELAAGFHAGFVMMLADGAEEVARARGLDLIALSGGTFQNRIVLETLMDELERRELRAIMHLSTPPGDGCVALGQAAVAQARWQ